jgi:hypothetical protein
MITAPPAAFIYPKSTPIQLNIQMIQSYFGQSYVSHFWIITYYNVGVGLKVGTPKVFRFLQTFMRIYTCIRLFEINN